MDLYQFPAIRSRLIEYCGGRNDDPSTCTAKFLIGNGETIRGAGIPTRDVIYSPRQLDTIISREIDVFRSVWDDRSLLAVLDIDYTNADFPYRAFTNPNEIFSDLEPVYRLAVGELKSFGIKHLSILTGQGYHLVFRLPLTAKVTRQLQTLYSLNDTLDSKYRYDHPFTDDTVPLKAGTAYSGLGYVLEYLAHRIIARSADASAIPVVANNLVVGTGRKGREAVSLDLSAYGDPLFTRYIRCAFSLYHRKNGQGTLVSLPRNDECLEDLLAWRTDAHEANRLAERKKLVIPESSNGLTSLLDAYLLSPLHSFHNYFESGYHDPVDTWSRTYDRLNTGNLPPCAGLPLMRPNPALYIPNNICNIARVLVSLGWHPRSVAGLIRSKYEKDYGWGINWLVYDAATRADFYVRLFCGLVAGGIDDLRDFNCISHQEQGFCPRPWCGHNLADYGKRLQRVSWN